MFSGGYGNQSDSSQAGAVMAQAKAAYPALESFTADQGFHRPAQAAHTLGCELHTTPKSQKGFALIAFRWRVERTFAWLGQCRLLAKDHQKAIASAEVWIWCAMLACWFANSHD